MSDMITNQRAAEDEGYYPSHIHPHSWISPVAAGLVTIEEFGAWQTYREAITRSWRQDKPVEGPADFRAVHVAALFNYSEPVTDRIYTDSIRYVWLVAFYELEWAGRRLGEQRFPTEVAARRLADACYAMTDADAEYEPYSRWRRHFAIKCGDRGSLERNGSIKYLERRQLLLRARKAHTKALRKVLKLVDAYKAVRWPKEDQDRIVPRPASISVRPAASARLSHVAT